jgi:metal-responsive CopG/Arc/MetJ family transcriptional regulator
MATVLARKYDGMTELRFDIPAQLAQRIDALMQVEGLDARHELLVPMLEKCVDAEFDRAIRLLRMARINPLESSSDGKSGE